MEYWGDRAFILSEVERFCFVGRFCETPGMNRLGAAMATAVLQNGIPRLRWE
jgi:hypothetical protein